MDEIYRMSDLVCALLFRVNLLTSDSPQNGTSSITSLIFSLPIKTRFPPSMKTQPPVVTLNEIQRAKDLCLHSMGGCKILEINASTILKV